MISIKNDREIELMRASAKVVAECFEHIQPLIVPGRLTKDIDAAVEKFIRSRGGKPAFKGMYGFPASACISVNEEVVHGVPSSRRVLEEGDIVSVDIGVLLNGYYGDAAYTFAVGQIDAEKQKLMQVTWESLQRGIANAIAGNRLQDIGSAVQQHAESRGFSVVRSLVGHGIGKNLHEEPQVPNYGKPGKGPLLKKGITLAIEPMINAGTANVSEASDGFTIVTDDSRPSAHYEHTVLITENGPEILTQHALNPLG